MRLFFAATLQEQAAEAVVGLQRALERRHPDAGVRWVGRDQLHYTLKFLGEVPEGRVADCCRAARQAVIGVEAFQVELDGLGGFPSRQAPSVLWVGACRGADKLRTLACRMDDALAALGFSPEIRPFKPHLTIARVKGKSAQGVAARLLATESVGALAVSGVDAIVLMQSVLSNQGATYSVVERFAL